MAGTLNVTKTPADVLFRVFTACAGDTKTLILDVRPLKEFKKKHIINAYSIRLAANGGTLLDYSKNTYDYSWSQDCWWDKHVVVYGDPELKRSHPVVAFLAHDKHAKSVNVYPDGLETFEQLYPFLVTPSTKANALRRYPGEIIPKLLYLGDWAHAEDTESLSHLNISKILTVHNNPENLRPPSKVAHKQMVLADVETEDISKYFNDSYTFIEAARVAKQGVLVHCGAGVSRSAAICIAYLMRKFNWPAVKAKAHCVQRRSVVQPNDGFWRSLCALEGQLGLQERSDPAAVTGFSGADAPARVSEDAAGEKVTVTFLSMAKVREIEAAAKSAEALRSTGKNGAQSNQQSRSEKGVSNNNAAGQNLASSRAHEERSSKGGDQRASGRDEPPGRDRNKSRESLDRGYSDQHRDVQERGRDDKDRQRGDHRDHQHRRRSRSRDRESGRGRNHADGGGERKRQRVQDTAPAEVKALAPVVLESSKEGKALGRLELGLHSSHQRCVFGRLPSNEVVLEHASISRQHAQLSLNDSRDLLITDLGSAHQTNVDGVWIRPQQGKVLQVGSVFKLGGSTREFKVIMTPTERTRMAAKKKKLDDLEEAKRNSGY